MAQYFISSDPNLLDREFIVRSLQTTYWAGDRSRDDILESLDGSICFGAYQTSSRQQVAFARVVTDKVTFSWLCDVFVDHDHRKLGLGKQIIAHLLADPRLVKTRMHLATKDAHGLYERFGFARLELMRRPPQPNQSSSPDGYPAS
jgi:GNAT superfamily N-acetyltransferase